MVRFLADKLSNGKECGRSVCRSKKRLRLLSAENFWELEEVKDSSSKEFLSSSSRLRICRLDVNEMSGSSGMTTMLRTERFLLKICEKSRLPS